MEYLGIVLFLWILGGTGAMAGWADRIFQRNDSNNIFFRSTPGDVVPEQYPMRQPYKPRR